MKKTDMKGTQTGVLVMTSLLMLALVMGVTTLPLNQALSKEITDSFSDLSQISQVKTYGDMRHHNEGLAAAEYSINNQTIELGKNGGGFTWTNNNIPTQTEIAEKLETEANKHLYQNYAGRDSLNACNSPQINHTLETKPTQENSLRINVSTHKGQKAENKPAEFICTFSKTKVKYTGKTPKYGENFRETTTATKHHAQGNRYFILSRETIDKYIEIHNTWSGNVGTVSKTSSDVCDPDSGDWESLESQAVNDVQEDVNTFDNVKNQEINVEGLTKSFSLNSYDLNLDYGEYNQNFDANEDTSTSNIHDCDCHSDHGEDASGSHCHSTEKDLHVEITPTESSVESTIEDEQNKIVSGTGWSNLQFRIDDYTHDFQNDDSLIER